MLNKIWIVLYAGFSLYIEQWHFYNFEALGDVCCPICIFLFCFQIQLESIKELVFSVHFYVFIDFTFLTAIEH